MPFDSIPNVERDALCVVTYAPLGCEIGLYRRTVAGVKANEVAEVALEALRCEPYSFGVVVPCSQGARYASDEGSATFAIGLWCHCDSRFGGSGWFGRFSRCWCLGRYGSLCGWRGWDWRGGWFFLAAGCDDGDCEDGQ